MRISTAITLFTMAVTSLLVNSVRAGAVIELDKSSFPEQIEKDLVMVNFYTKWCGHCQKLEPEYEKAAKELEADGVIMAKINCEENSEYCKLQHVSSYPTLKIYKKGKVTEYNSARSAEDLVMYMRRQTGPAVKQIMSKDLATFSKSSRVVVVAVLPKDEPGREELAEIVERAGDYFRDDFNFGMVESSPDIKESGVVLYKQFDEGKNVLEGTFTDLSLMTFIRDHYTPIIDEMGPKNYKHYLESSTPLAYLFYGSEADQKQYSHDLEGLAKELKGKLNFVYVDAKKFGAHADNVGLEKTWPAFSIQNVLTAEKYPLDQEQKLTFERIKDHVDKILNHELAPKIKSEAIPEDQDGPVTIVVGRNYKEIVEDQSKDVLIEYYAPWCGFCKMLAPIYDEVGELYKGSNIVIAKIDATANDLPATLPFAVKGYPTIKFRKANSSKYIDYAGERTKAGFIKFLNANAENKVEVDGAHYLKSETVPGSQDGPVTIVVAKNFAEIVQDQTKDVLIEFYAPWCGFCKQLAPIYDKVGEMYKGSNIVVAKMDATANDLPASMPFKVDGYPTIKFRKAGSSEYMEYSGKRTKEAFVEFLTMNAVNKMDPDMAHDEL
ncbi:protein disulfide-isomerase precursor [Podila humilis]|nr:protein disulfide-isomerase precursor [Podila humilis]